MARPSLLGVCMHEAGHAIVQLATGPGKWINYLEVDLSSETRLGYVHTVASWQPWMRSEPAPAELLHLRRRLAAGDVVNFMAGEMAELRWQRCQRYMLKILGDKAGKHCFEHHAAGDTTDGGMVRNRLEWLMPGEERAGFTKAWIATESVVADWWHEIVRLGRELARRGRIEDKLLYPLWNEMRDARGKAALTRAAQLANWLGSNSGEPASSPAFPNPPSTMVMSGL